MKLNNISFGFALVSLIICIVVIVDIKSNTKEISRLNNKLDSLIINNNNYSYSHITTFENKTPEEGIDKALQYYNI